MSYTVNPDGSVTLHQDVQSSPISLGGSGCLQWTDNPEESYRDLDVNLALVPRLGCDNGSTPLVTNHLWRKRWASATQRVNGPWISTEIVFDSIDPNSDATPIGGGIWVGNVLISSSSSGVSDVYVSVIRRSKESDYKIGFGGFGNQMSAGWAINVPWSAALLEGDEIVVTVAAYSEFWTLPGAGLTESWMYLV